MNTALQDMENLGARLTVGIQGSFGILHYAVLAFTTAYPTTNREPNAEHRASLTEELLGRGFRPACNADVEDIVLKAQRADNSIRCRASPDGLISLLVDDSPVWLRQCDPEYPDTALWLKAARTRDVTIISGDHLLISEREVDLRSAASLGSLVMAKVPTGWTR